MVPMTLIRAPYIEAALENSFDARHMHGGCAGQGISSDVGGQRDTEISSGVELLARVDGRIVAARFGNQLGMAFHPELDEDDRIHEMFLGMCNGTRAV